MDKLCRGLRLYRHYISINIRSAMQYKMSFFLTAVGQFLVSFNVFLGIFFMFQRFSRVEGFTYSEVLLGFSIILMEFSLAEMSARGFDLFPRTVRSGEFDRILVRPRNEILQVLGSNASKVVTVLFMLIGGTAVFSGLFLIYAALCFFTLDGLEFMNVFTDGAREFGKYPVGVYGKKILLFSTFVVPYALIQYYPLLYLLERRTEPIYIVLPLLACLFLLPAYGLWRFGVGRYQSSGS